MIRTSTLGVFADPNNLQKEILPSSSEVGVRREPQSTGRQVLGRNYTRGTLGVFADPHTFFFILS